MKAYLAHPWKRKEKIRSWELNFKHSNIEFVNPFFTKENLSGIAEITTRREGKEVIHNKTDQQIVEDDLYLIRHCDCLVAFIDSSKTYGTLMEIMYAWVHKIPIYLVITTKYRSHPWLRYCSNKIFNSLKEFEKFIVTIK